MFEYIVVRDFVVETFVFDVFVVVFGRPEDDAAAGGRKGPAVLACRSNELMK